MRAACSTHAGKMKCHATRCRACTKPAKSSVMLRKGCGPTRHAKSWCRIFRPLSAKLVAHGYDIYYMESEWRDMWVASGRAELGFPEKAFVAFCKKRYQMIPNPSGAK